MRDSGGTYALDNPSHPGCTERRCDAKALRHALTSIDESLDLASSRWIDGLCGFCGNPARAWNPVDLKLVLQTHLAHGSMYHAPAWHSGYNELILSSYHINKQLPQAILGFFYPRGSPTITSVGNGIVIDIVKAHEAFLHSYGLSDADVPLLILDADDWDEPFKPALSRSVLDQIDTT